MKQQIALLREGKEKKEMEALWVSQASNLPPGMDASRLGVPAGTVSPAQSPSRAAPPPPPGTFAAVTKTDSRPSSPVERAATPETDRTDISGAFGTMFDSPEPEAVSRTRNSGQGLRSPEQLREERKSLNDELASLQVWSHVRTRDQSRFLLEGVLRVWRSFHLFFI